jgi:EmrB/QacA subfamily drug resistance transporter
MLLRYRSTHGRLVLIVSILGSGMAYLDSTAVNVALPAIETDLHAGFAGLQWILNGYLIALAALVLPGGSLGDRLGRRRIFLIGLTWFAAASIICGIAPSAAVLIGARVLQGIGAALLVPASLAMVQGTFEDEDRGQAIGAWSGFSGLTTIIGPLLGGWFADTFSWRLVFLINPLLALVTALLAWRWVPETREARARELDPAGALAAAIGLSGVAFTLIEGPHRGWSDSAVLTAGLVGLLGIGAFVMIEMRVRDPMLPLGFFRSVRFTGVTAATVLIYFALGGVMFLLTLQLQRVLGYSALAAGAALVPVTLMLLVLSPVAGRIASRMGPRLPMTAGPLVAAAGVAWMSGIDAGVTYVAAILPPALVFGLGLALTVAPLTATAMASLDDEHAGLASGVSNAVTRTAQLLAISMLPLMAGLSGITRVGGERLSAGFHQATWIGAAVLAGGAAIAVTTIRGPLRLPK